MANEYERAQGWKWVVMFMACGLIGLALVGGVALAESKSPQKPGVEGGQQPTTDCGLAWRHVESPSFLSGTTTVYDVDALAANDIWAVGVYQDGNYDKSLTMHWDGTHWTIIYSPNLGSATNYLNGVKMISANDVWAVGSYQDTSAYKTLTMHWNGSTWQLITSPNTGTGNNWLNKVEGTSANNLMAVGYFSDTIRKTLVLRWNGASWLVQTSPSPGTVANYLNGVTAIASNNIWAAGYYQTGTSGKTLIEHWNGTAWSQVTSPNVSGADNYLQGINGQNANDMWAVGSYSMGPNQNQTLIMHWNGTSWTIVPSPNISGASSYLSDVAAIGASDVWVVGGAYDGTNNYALMTHWDGSTWTIVSTPNPSTSLSLDALTSISTGDVWSMGHYSVNSDTFSLAEHWNGSAWSVIFSPNAGPYENILRDIDAVSANDIWAVGEHSSYEDPQTPASDGLVMHWNGSAWSVVPSPHVGAATYLQGVEAISANDVWAVGYYFDNSYLLRTLTIHWNGTVWSVVQSPNEGTGATGLLHLTAVASNNVWAVGYYTNGSTERTLTMRWDGLGWSTISSPNVGIGNNVAEDVEALSASDIWAVGFSTNAGLLQTLTMHWNGTMWSVVASPNVGTSSNFLSGLGARATDDIWAVGNYNNASGNSQTLTMHWNGNVWSIVPSSNGGSASNILFDVEVLSPGDAWAIGYYNDPSTSYTMLVMHWNGSAWSVIGTPAVGDYVNLYGIAAVSSSNVWATGYFGDGAYSIVRSLTMQYSDPCANVTPTVTNTATATPIGPTATATTTAVATACAIEFSDVPQDSTFYQYIRCLACRGIINGYGDGTFKPANNVTRGQLSKIISNAAGFSDPQTSQMFEDVPVGSTFQEFVGRLASRGYISGYACGGAGEPCGAGNLPYFRPNANATRGQITKIDSNAAEFNDAPNGQQFEDIVVGSTFYTYTYRLASRSIMAGYACGGAGEPCGAGNLPYFRPNNNATRGQTSKVVANTFFPSCATP